MADNEEPQEEETWMEDVSENKIVQLVGLVKQLMNMMNQVKNYLRQ